MHWDNIDTENLITCEEMEGTQRQTAQSTQTAYCEYLLRTESLTVANSLQCWLMLGACVQPNTWQTFLKPLEKKKGKKATPI